MHFKKRILKLGLAAGLAGCLAFGTTACAEESELTRIVLAFMTWIGSPTDTQMVQDAINEITRERYGIEVELQISDASTYKQNITLALSSGEQIDIVNMLGCGYSSMVQQGYLLDLEENDLLQNYGAGIIEQMGEISIDACRVDGVLYGLPNNRDLAQGRGGVVIAAEYLDGIGYEYDKEAEIIQVTEEEIDNIYKQLHEAYLDKEVYRPVTGSFGQACDLDCLGGNVFGVLEDYGKETTVVNPFDTETYKNYCQRMYEFNQAGYISQDAATDTTSVGELVKAGTLMSYTTTGKPGIKTQETNLCGREMVIFQTGKDFTDSSYIANFPWALTLNTVNAEKAMTLLNAFYTDADLANLLSWGIEGVHYEETGDGTIDYPADLNASNSGWCHSVQWELPNQFITYVWSGNDPELWNKTREFNDNAEKSACMGFIFDSNQVATEFTSVQNVYDEYQKSLEYGFVDPSTGIPEMIEKMESAGLSRIIAEKQAQLDAWLTK